MIEAPVVARIEEPTIIVQAWPSPSDVDSRAVFFRFSRRHER